MRHQSHLSAAVHPHNECNVHSRKHLQKRKQALRGAIPAQKQERHDRGVPRQKTQKLDLPPPSVQASHVCEEAQATHPKQEGRYRVHRPVHQQREHLHYLLRHHVLELRAALGSMKFRKATHTLT